MGGKAFAGRDPPINTPRMSPDDYFSLKKQYLALISTVFERCACPIEAPGKDSYGDIDILVCEPKNLLSGTQSALGARTTCESSTCLQPISRNSNGSQSTPQSSSSSTDTDAKDSTETRTVVPIRIHWLVLQKFPTLVQYRLHASHTLVAISTLFHHARLPKLPSIYTIKLHIQYKS